MQTALVQIAQQPKRNVVRRRNNSRSVHANQLLSCKIRIRNVIIAGQHKRLIKLQALLAKCANVAVEARAAGVGGGVDHACDSAMTVI